MRLSRLWNIPHISTGDIFRMTMKMDTPLGHEVRGYMERNEFVPDDVTLRMVQGRLAIPDCKAGFILDGFPRTVPQAALFHGDLDAAVFFDLDDDAIVRRITGRRTDPRTGDIYHLEFRPPPEGLTLVQRADDTEEAVRKRLADYDAKTAPLVDFYEGMDLAVHIDASGAIEDVYQRLISELQ
jgi:adenylate kinase